jgi:hypothetical protein
MGRFLRQHRLINFSCCGDFKPGRIVIHKTVISQDYSLTLQNCDMKPFKILIFVVSISLPATTLFSQTKNTITFSLGSSFPIGAFAKTSLDPGVAAGFAGTGIFADALIQKKISQSGFAVGGLLATSMNFFKLNKILANYQKGSPQFEWTGKYSNWISVSIMPGFSYSTVLSSKVSFNAGLFTGPAMIHSPGYTISGVVIQAGYTGNAEGKQDSKLALTIASRLNTAIQFQAGKKTKLQLQAGYSFLKPTFKKIVQTYNEVTGPVGSPIFSARSSRSEFGYTQSINTVNAGLGLILEL